jgi:hypothetical protein
MTDSGSIGILFDIDGLGGGFYRWSAFKIFFQNVAPDRVANSQIFDGDTADTLAGRARTYCIAVEASDSATIEYVRSALGRATQDGLLPEPRRFISDPTKHPLVPVARVSSDGVFHVAESEGIGQAWAEGTPWKISRD